MLVSLFRLPAAWLPLWLLLGWAAGGCASRHFYQADARVGPGSQAPLPPTADSVVATAGRQYQGHWAVYYWLFGRHYRRVWAAPVVAPVLHLPTAVPGGLVPGKVGGGYQSISMTLLGTRHREFALRALDKEPSKTLPKVLRATFLLNVVRDATSAAMPYGAFTVPPLAEAAGVPHTRPRLVYVRPDETGLGAASERFQGKLALLEEKFETVASATPRLAGVDDFDGSEKMLTQLYDHPATYIDQPAFLRARLLDVWLGDWDRHEGQWEWAAFRQPDGRLRYQAAPKDRDQVYFRFDDGLIPWLASRRFAVPRLQTFRARYGNVRGLVQQARFIDQRALSALTRADFQRMAAELQRRLPDSLIGRAMHRLPPAVYALEGAHLAGALQARRAALPQAAEAFYRSLARTPTVGGTEQAERVLVHRYPDSTTVCIFSPALAQRTRADSLRFRRTYFSAETRRLTIDGLGGDDVFEVHTSGEGQPMKLRLYGGPGHDRLLLKGPGRHLRLYDTATDLRAAGGPRPHQPRKSHPPYNRLHR